jgi:heme-degrading monooxygenase HmoA
MRRKEFEHIGEQHLTPLLESREGFGGVLFLYGGEEATVMTLWTNAAAADEFNESAEASKLGQQVRESGILRGEPRVEVLEVVGGSFKS